MGAMTPAAKRQLLQALMATSSALSSQSLDHSGFKTALNQKNDKTSVGSNSKKQEFDAGENKQGFCTQKVSLFTTVIIL